MNRRPARPRHTTAPASLPPDSLATSIDLAARLVEAVIDGRALTEQLARLRAEHSDPGINWGAIQDLSYGCLRDYGRGDALLRPFLSKPLPTHVHAILLVSVYRLEARPDTAHTVVDQAVSAVGQRAPGLKGVANGVLRNVVRQRDALIARLDADHHAALRHPAWWIKRLRETYPTNWQTILAAGNMHPPMSLRINPRRIDRHTALALLREADIAFDELPNQALRLHTPLPVDQIPRFFEGVFSVQDAGAQWAARWLAPQAGDRVLDACAAPGGKSAHLLELADIDLTALELDPRRAGRIRENLDRLGLSARVVVGDATQPAQWWDGIPFDRILADVPCSASGVVRRHPDIKWLRRPKDIAGFARQQAQILDALWQTLAPGGTMLYVTCSVFDEENRGQMADFCTRHRDAVRIAIEDHHDQIVLPNAEHDGFYYALLGKTP
ncbi:MAG: 16S rRNA (cytosine(967)-C(5))-methyltransferase RsmB [Rhodocyclaceae bacterium]|nr:16S rRNA (cytosine(967)-C(5))-methyltransferase RsmB [Rhodocyclaceae bacterium]